MTSDTGEDLAFFRMARHNRAHSGITLTQGAILNIQSQTTLTVVCIRTVTGKTPICQERPDIPVEVNRYFIAPYRCLGHNAGHAECSDD